MNTRAFIAVDAPPPFDWQAALSLDRSNSPSFYTYLHCKPDGTPFYVGKGCGRRAYRMKSGRNKDHKSMVSQIGIENVLVYIFPCDSEEEAFADEIQQIAQLRRDGVLLANHSLGGEGSFGWSHAVEAKRKIGIASKGNKYAIGNKNSLGRVASDGTRAKLSAAHLGKKHTDEARSKMSISRLGNKNSAGYRHSEETLKKISAALKGNKSNTGRKLPLEQRQKMSAAQKLRWAKKRSGV